MADSGCLAGPRLFGGRRPEPRRTACGVDAWRVAAVGLGFDRLSRHGGVVCKWCEIPALLAAGASVVSCTVYRGWFWGCGSACGHASVVAALLLGDVASR